MEFEFEIYKTLYLVGIGMLEDAKISHVLDS